MSEIRQRTSGEGDGADKQTPHLSPSTGEVSFGAFKKFWHDLAKSIQIIF